MLEELLENSPRHIVASIMIVGDADLATADGILGHAQPSTTLDI